MYIRIPTRRGRPVWVAHRSPRHRRPKPNDDKQTSGWFRTIGDARNSLLVAASLVYLLGYAVWSIHAWDKNLGLLPLIDSQYFIAGAVPVATLLLAIYAFGRGQRFIGILEEQLDLSKTGWRLFLSRLSIAIFVMALVVFLVSSSEWFERIYPSTAERIALVSASIWAISAFFAPWAGGVIQQWFRKLMLGYLVTVLCVIGALSSIWILGWLPQELGGTRLRCATISAPKSVISEEMLQQIFASSSGAKEIVQSDMVAVLYSGRYLLFTLHDSVTTGKGSESIVHELPRDIVKGITWYPKCPGDSHKGGGGR